MTGRVGRTSHLIHYFVMFFGLFVILQDLIAMNLGGASTFSGRLVKYADEVIILILFCLNLALLVLKGRIPLRSKIELPMLAFTAVAILSSIEARVPLGIASTQLFLYLKGFLFFYILASLPVSEKILRRYVRFFLWIAIVVLALGIVDVLAPEWFRTATGNRTYIDYRLVFPSVQSIFIHPAVFGWFMSFIGLYCLAFLLCSNRARYLAGGVLFPLGALLSVRRKQIGGIFGGLLAGLMLQKRGRRARYLARYAFVVFLFLLASWPAFSTLYEHTVEEYLSDPMKVARVNLYVTGLDLAKDHFPLGAGLGRYGSWMSRVHYSPVYDETGLSEIYGLSEKMPSFVNDTFWPMVLGETGILGLVLFVGVILHFLRLMARAYRTAQGQNERYAMAFLLGTFMVAVEGLIESVVVPTFVSPPEVYFIFGSLGVGYSLSRHLDGKRTQK
jgi:uncharacterized membrane protein (DUF106 family)